MKDLKLWLRRSLSLFLVLALLIGCSGQQGDQNANEQEEPTAVEETVETNEESSEEGEEEVDPVYGAKNGIDLIELVDEKPEVAPVEVRNEPNRIAVNITEDPSTSMAFNWFTSEKMDGYKVVVSKNEDLSDPIEFEAQANEILSEYAERD